MPKLKVRKVEYYQDQGDFLQKLKEFHNARGTPLGRLPTFGGQSLDLYALYNTVTSLGGISVVTDRKKWDDVFRLLGFPPCTNAAYALRQHYARYLESYEKIFFFGEDDENTDQNLLLSQRLRYRRINKAPKLGHFGEPLVHNFDRISFSLQSGLTNEVNFALNICALLSNVTNSIFNLVKSRNILNLILAHVGIWCKDDHGMKELYKEWYKEKDDCFKKFWLKNLDSNMAKALYLEAFEVSSGDVVQTQSLVDSSLFASFLQSKDLQLCRADQVALILYNFSFEQINAMHMASHESTKRFLLLSSCSKVSSLCKSGLETLDNICHFVDLHMECKVSQFMLYTLDKFLSSVDKFKRSKAISVLGKLALNESNSVVLSSALSTDCYYRLIQMLHLPDVVLILSSLDALYSLSGLCESTATGISMVHGGIEVLISLLTIRAESFGNGAIKGYRIIENKHSIFTQKNQELLQQREMQIRHQQAQARQRFQNEINPHQFQTHHHLGVGRGPPSLPMSSHPPYYRQPTSAKMPPIINRDPLPHPQIQQAPSPHINLSKSTEELVEIDPEIFAAHWLSANYEPTPEGKLSIQDIYKDFCGACEEFKRKAILPEPAFFNLLKSILPPHISHIEGNTPGEFTISVGKRKNVIQIQSVIPKSVHDNLLMHKSALLKRSNPNPNGPIDPQTPLAPNHNEIKNDSIADNEAENKSQTTLADFQNDPQYKHILENKDLNSLQVCQDLAEKLKADSQFHFTQFHVHRQQFQAMQYQMQQIMPQIQSESATEQPLELIKNITMRTQMHHQVMQVHYTQLESLSKLLMHVQRKLVANDAGNNSIATENPLKNQFPMQKPNFPLPGTPPNGVFPEMNMPFQTFQQTPIKQNSASKSGRGKSNRPKATRGVSAQKKRTSRGSSRGANRSKSSNPELMQQFHQGNFNSTPHMTNILPPYNNMVPSSFPPRVPNLQSYPLRSPNLTSKFTHSPCSSFLPPGKSNDTSQSSSSAIMGDSIDLNDTNILLTNRLIQQKAEKSASREKELDYNHLPVQGASADDVINPTIGKSCVSTSIVDTSFIESSNLMECNSPASVTVSVTTTSAKNSIPVENKTLIDSLKDKTVLQKQTVSIEDSISRPHSEISNSNYSSCVDEIVSPTVCTVSSQQATVSNEITHSTVASPGVSSPSIIEKADVSNPSSPQVHTESKVFKSANNNVSPQTDHCSTITAFNTTTLADDKLFVDTKSYSTDPTNDETESHANKTDDLTGEDTVNTQKKDKSVTKGGFPIKNGEIDKNKLDTHKLHNGDISENDTNLLNGHLSESEDTPKENSRKRKLNFQSKSIEKGSDYSMCNGHLNGHVDKSLQENGGKPLTNGIDNHVNEILNESTISSSTPTTTDHEQHENIETNEDAKIKTKNSSSDLLNDKEKSFKEMTLNIENPNSQKVLSNTSKAVVENPIDNSHENTTENVPPDVAYVSERNDADIETTKKCTPSYHCLWESCNLPDFKEASSLLNHMIITHAPLEGRIGFCMVKECRKASLLRGAMILHFQEKHCVTIRDDGTSKKVPLSDKLFANKLTPPPYLEDESPVTRSVRYTAALILRNIARKSPYGKSLISRYENRITLVAMSNSEAAIAASDCLSELQRDVTPEDELNVDKETIADDDVECCSETSDYEMSEGFDEFNYEEDDLLTYAADSPEAFS